MSLKQSYFLKSGEGRLVGEISQYTTRHKDDYYISKTRLKKSEQDALYSGASLYNALPQSIKEKKNQKNFKGVIKNFLIEKTIYSLAEYYERCRSP